eukprot:g20632.t1
MPIVPCSILPSNRTDLGQKPSKKVTYFLGVKSETAVHAQTNSWHPKHPFFSKGWVQLRCCTSNLDLHIAKKAHIPAQQPISTVKLFPSRSCERYHISNRKTFQYFKSGASKILEMLPICNRLVSVWAGYAKPKPYATKSLCQLHPPTGPSQKLPPSALSSSRLPFSLRPADTLRFVLFGSFRLTLPDSLANISFAWDIKRTSDFGLVLRVASN